MGANTPNGVLPTLDPDDVVAFDRSVRDSPAICRQREAMSRSTEEFGSNKRSKYPTLYGRLIVLTSQVIDDPAPEHSPESIGLRKAKSRFGSPSSVRRDDKDSAAPDPSCRGRYVRRHWWTAWSSTQFLVRYSGKKERAYDSRLVSRC